MPDEAGYIKKENVILIALGALVIGFLGGIVFSIYKSPTLPATVSQQPGAPPQQGGQQQGGMSPQQASQLLALEQEVQQNPNNASAWSQLGHIWFDTNQHAKAIEAYEKSLAISPGDANVLTDLGVMYRRSNQPEKAIETFNKAIAADPRHEVSRFNKGIVLYFDMNDKAQAIQVWQQLLEVNPNATAPNGQPIGEFITSMQSQ